MIKLRLTRIKGYQGLLSGHPHPSIFIFSNREMLLINRGMLQIMATGQSSLSSKTAYVTLLDGMLALPAIVSFFLYFFLINNWLTIYTYCKASSKSPILSLPAWTFWDWGESTFLQIFMQTGKSLRRSWICLTSASLLTKTLVLILSLALGSFYASVGGRLIMKALCNSFAPSQFQPW